MCEHCSDSPISQRIIFVSHSRQASRMGQIDAELVPFRVNSGTVLRTTTQPTPSCHARRDSGMNNALGISKATHSSFAE